MTITLETNYSNLAVASITKILFIKPNGDKGSWDAAVSGSRLVYNVQNGDINVNGNWQFQAYIEVGGLKGMGDIVSKSFDISLL